MGTNLRIYKNPTHSHVDIPNLDLLTLLFDSEHSWAQPDSLLHVDAEFPNIKLTKSSLRTLSTRIAYSLRHKLSIGVSPQSQDVITVISYGQPVVPALLFGALTAGGVYSAASPSSTASELARQIRIGKSKWVICGSEFVDVVREAIRLCDGAVGLDAVAVIESRPTWSLKRLSDGSELLSGDKVLEWKKMTDRKKLEESLAVILWSSGTTGPPKGVMLSHFNLVSETYITSVANREWVIEELTSGRLKDPEPYRTLGHLPISHIAGLFGYLIAGLYSGGTVMWMRRYSWLKLLQFAREYKISAFYTVPSIYLRMAKSKDVTDQFKHVEAASTGAAPMDGKLQKDANGKLGEGGQGTFVGQTWGLSETTGAVTMQVRGIDPDVTGSIGPLLPNVELRIVDEDFKDVKPGTPGELILKAPVVTRGYFDNPEATQASFHDGWFLTGDIGEERNGKFYVVDRKKELLKYKGLQIAPAELESLLITHPNILEAAVIGVPNPSDPSSDLPRAYVVAEESKVSSEEVKSYVAERLAAYKQLRGGVVFVNELPKSAIGKLLRRELKVRAKEEMRREGARL